MKNRERKSKISYYALTGVFCICAIASIVLCVLDLVFDLPTKLFIFSAILLLLSLFFAYVYFAASKLIHDQYKTMYATAPLIETNYADTQKRLKEMGFVSSEHFSSFGLPYFEYRDDFNTPDNKHIEFDTEKKIIVTYTLYPYDFRQFAFSDFKSCSVKPDFKGNDMQLLLLDIIVSFNNGFDFSLCVSDGKLFSKDTEDYFKYIKQANDVKNLIESIVSGENNES